MPLTLGHVLVVTRGHSVKVGDCGPAEIADVGESIDPIYLSLYGVGSQEVTWWLQYFVFE